MFKLVAMVGNAEYPLGEGRVTVGRDESCDICIAEGKISKQHAALVIDQDRITVEDLDSTNGTFVNNRQIQTQRTVSVGDVIQFESMAYCVVSSSDEAHTVLARNLPQTPSAGQSKFAIEAEDSAHTVFEQDFSLPAHWPSAEEDSMFADRGSQYDAKQVDAVLSQHVRDTDGLTTVFVIMSEPHDPPLFGLRVNQQKHHWTLGRAPEQSICLSNMSVSGQHATLIYDEGRWAIRDEQSRNHVKVNGKVEQLCPLVDGDVVTLGNVDLVFRAIG